MQPDPAAKCTPVLLFQTHPKRRKFGEYVREQVAQQQDKRQSVLQADALEEDESYYPTRSNTSARRYNVSPETVYQQGNTRLHIRYVDVPPRRSRQQLPPPRERH